MQRPTVVALCLAVSACSESRVPGSAFEAYGNENVTVIGGGAGERITVSAPVGEGECVTVSDNLCVPVDTTGEWCRSDGGPVDIVVVDGEVVEVICYPSPSNDGKPIEVVDTSQQGGIDVLQNANGTAVTFASSTDGQPITGDVLIDGNDVSLYGNGPDKTILDGNVSVSGNKARLRGLTITGDLMLDKNNASVVLCRVLGNVVLSTLSTNSSVFVENDVFGSFTCDSNTNTLTGNDILGAWVVTGNSNVCDANATFTDTNLNQWVDEGERGDALGCP